MRSGESPFFSSGPHCHSYYRGRADRRLCGVAWLSNFGSVIISSIAAIAVFIAAFIIVFPIDLAYLYLDVRWWCDDGPCVGDEPRGRCCPTGVAYSRVPCGSRGRWPRSDQGAQRAA